MAWSPWQSDKLLDTFIDHPGTVTIVRPDAIVSNPMTRIEAEQIAAAIRERAAERQITVEVTIRPINGEPTYANVEVKHLVAGSTAFEPRENTMDAGDEDATGSAGTPL